ncbi:MAG: TRAP transporter substrate-binding protein [Hyphomonadaceae bacterium]|jgi:TRAP-type C4-dicarboxylate transport system substrate-binding protein|nr:TRAP transporter substrate-binding protein [Hyphomonadaceae bacterium]
MTVSRRSFLAATGAALAAPAIARPALAQAQVTLKLHHFLPPVSNGHAKMLAPWAKMVEQDSGGRIKIDIFPSMQLGGTPPQLYDQARDGVVDIVWTLPGSTAGRFPSTEVFELPFIGARRGIVNARASQEYATANLGKETADIKLLSFWSHDHGLIHANKAVNTMEDLKGLKLRSPNRLAGEALKALGATAVPMPIPQVPESIAQRAIDGAVVPWEVVPAIKLDELVKFHTEIPGSPTFYTASFFLAMNKAKYEGLPADLKAAIDKNSGMKFAELAGNMWDDAGALVLERVKKRGNTIITISADEKAKWIKTTEPVIDAWIKQVKEKGLDGGKLIEQAKALVAKYDKA